MVKNKKSDTGIDIDVKEQEQVVNKDDSKVEIDENMDDSSPDSKDDDRSEEEILLDKVTTLEEKLLHSMADLDNYKKRSIRQFDEIVKSANDKLFCDFLEISDSLERALVHANGNSGADDIRKGTELIAKQLSDLLTRYQVTAIDAIGRKFDATRHEALMNVASDEFPEGTVAMEVARGYMIEGRVLRYSKVAVSKGPESKNEEKEIEIKEK